MVTNPVEPDDRSFFEDAVEGMFQATVDGRRGSALSCRTLSESLGAEIGDRKRSECALRSLVAGISGSVGQEFFRSLVEHMAVAFGVRYALVGELLPGGERVRTLAAWSGDALTDDFEYVLRGTPCSNVIAGGPCVYEDRVQERFPADGLLARLGAQSYCGIPLRDSSGTALGILAVLDDQRLPGPDEQTLGLLQVFAARAQAEIERLRAERALRRSEERFAQAFQTSPGCLLMLRLEDGRLIDVNDAFERLTGFVREEALGRTSLELGLWATRRGFLEAAAALRRHGRLRDHEHAFRAKDGRLVLGRCSADLLSFSDDVYVFGTIVDVTDQRRLEQQQRDLLRRIEAVAFEWQQTFDAIDAPTLILDAAGHVIRLNRAATLCAGQTYSDVLGDDLTVLGPYEPWLTARRLLKDVRRTRSPGTMQVDDPRSGVSWSVFAAPAALDAAKSDEGVILMARDVTATVKLQQSLRRTERMSAIGALVAGVAHEVRNPLFAITANLDALEAELSAGKAHEESLAVVNEAVTRLSRLMADLLDFGSPASGQRVSGALDEVVRLAARSCEPLARDKGVSLDVELVAPLPPVCMDCHRLGQVFQNLLQNAVQHAPVGGAVAVTVMPVELGGRVWVDCHIDDSGPGIDLADLPRLFEPFFTRRRGGTGLGLSIVQKIVEEHGGTVSASNRSEGGARLVVRLPGADSREEALA